MRTTNFAIAVAAALAAAACTTVNPNPAVASKECFYPACSLSVEVVDDGKGGKQLKVESDGNVRMGTRHRLVAIVWNLKTPGYEFRPDSILPHAARVAGKPATSYGAWTAQIIPHAYWIDTYSVTNQNSEPGIIYYDITVYPDRYTPGSPVTFQAAIANDAWQGRQSGWVSMK